MVDFSIVAEMRHRMANDLALVVAVLHRHRFANALTASEAIDDAVGAILSLSLHYRQLYETPADADFVPLSSHLDRLASALRLAYLDRLGIRLDCQLCGVDVPPHVARDIGMIVVELVGNSAKHAFDEEGGHILLELADDRDGLRCRVTDDGRGVDVVAAGRSERGLANAARIAAALGGRLEGATNVARPGADFTLVIPAIAA